MTLVNFEAAKCLSGELPFDVLRFSQSEAYNEIDFGRQEVTAKEIFEKFGLDPENAELQQLFLFEVVNSCRHNWACQALLWKLRHQFPDEKFFHRTLADIDIKEHLTKLLLSFADFQDWSDRWPEVIQMISLSDACTSFSDLSEYLEDQCFSEEEVLDLLCEFANKAYESARSSRQGGGPPRAVFLPLAYAIVESLEAEAFTKVLDIPVRQMIVWKIQKFLRGHHELLESNTHGQYAGLNNLLPMVSGNWLYDVLPLILVEESIDALARGKYARVFYLLNTLRDYVNETALPTTKKLIESAARKAEKHLGRYDIAAELHYMVKNTETYTGLSALAKRSGQDRKLEMEFSGMA
jgi:hypothetical protein